MDISRRKLIVAGAAMMPKVLSMTVVAIAVVFVARQSLKSPASAQSSSSEEIRRRRTEASMECSRLFGNADERSKRTDACQRPCMEKQTHEFISCVKACDKIDDDWVICFSSRVLPLYSKKVR